MCHVTYSLSDTTPSCNPWLRLKRNFDAHVTVNYADVKYDPTTFKNMDVVIEQHTDSIVQAATEAASRIGITNPEVLSLTPCARGSGVGANKFKMD